MNELAHSPSIKPQQADGVLNPKGIKPQQADGVLNPKGINSEASPDIPIEAKQLRPGLWETVNERYPGSMITKDDIVPLARLKKPLSESRLTFVSSAGVQPKGTLPFDVVHPVGDYSFRRVPSNSKPSDLEIHQIKYPTHGAVKDLNVIFPIERLQELAAEHVIGGLTPNFFSFIGYNMNPEAFERTLAEDIADAVVADGADAVLLSPA